MENSSKLKTPKRRDVAYYRQRQRNRVLATLVKFFSEEAERRGITKRDWAEATGKEPSQLTRWTTTPSNLELDTISELLLPFDAEMDYCIVRFADRSRPNYAHPLMRESLLVEPQRKSPTKTTESHALPGTKAPPSTTKVQATVVASSV